MMMCVVSNHCGRRAVRWDGLCLVPVGPSGTTIEIGPSFCVFDVVLVLR